MKSPEQLAEEWAQNHVDIPRLGETEVDVYARCFLAGWYARGARIAELEEDLEVAAAWIQKARAAFAYQIGDVTQNVGDQSQHPDGFCPFCRTSMVCLCERGDV